MTGVEELRNFEQHTDLKQDYGLPRYFLALLNGVIKFSMDYPLNRNVFFSFGSLFINFREVALFMLTLKRFKSKMNSVIAKRSAEILKSVAENINSQLKNVEHQMQVDA